MNEPLQGANDVGYIFMMRLDYGLKKIDTIPSSLVHTIDQGLMWSFDDE